MLKIFVIEASPNRLGFKIDHQEVLPYFLFFTLKFNKLDIKNNYDNLL